LGWLAEDAGIKWKKNALRHSFCSYRLAVIEDAAKVAYEAGNSAERDSSSLSSARATGGCEELVLD
jgi:hypothetical protein